MNTEVEKRYRVYNIVRCEKYGVGSIAHLRMRNLSKTGAGFEVLKSLDRFKQGEILRMVLQLDELQKQRVFNAEIIWAKDKEFGVRFIKPDDLLKKLYFSPMNINKKNHDY